MGLTSWINRTATGGARVLLVEVPGSAHTRIAAEQAVRALGWRPALSPADADVLLVCGQPGDAMRMAVERLWAQLPGPAAQVGAAQPDQVAGALHRAVTVLLRGDRSAEQDRPPRAYPEPGQHSGGHEMPAPETGHDDDMGSHDMDMPMPGGIGLAEGDQDRDGLEMDVLSLSLGAVLPHWPAGLVLHCVVHGDVIASARPEMLSGANPEAPMDGEDARFRAAWDCDAVSRLLALAGRTPESAGLRRIRDDLLAGDPRGDSLNAVQRWSRHVRRSRLLRWSLRDLGRVSARELVERGLSGEMAGDVHDRLLNRLDGIADFLRSSDGPDAAGRGDDATRALAVVELLPTLVVGLDLGAARLVVASLAPDVAAAQRLESNHG